MSRLGDEVLMVIRLKEQIALLKKEIKGLNCYIFGIEDNLCENCRDDCDHDDLGDEIEREDAREN
jgi:hypothetical protein